MVSDGLCKNKKTILRHFERWRVNICKNIYNCQILVRKSTFRNERKMKRNKRTGAEAEAEAGAEAGAEAASGGVRSAPAGRSG